MCLQLRDVTGPGGESEVVTACLARLWDQHMFRFYSFVLLQTKVSAKDPFATEVFDINLPSYSIQYRWHCCPRSPGIKSWKYLSPVQRIQEQLLAGRSGITLKRS
ncbi:hypothetical protein KIL84_008754 [Mauremys mutica]|uniref:Uncharacterized protein n=1 Tax=Mauremys mutica TaxID=74926 RepID=A0A9D4AY18_9SAUR|nr:hypothetical protein KIL84_008754 [Mauremys mutica]